MLDLRDAEIDAGRGFCGQRDHSRREIDADRHGAQAVSLGGYRAWSGCNVQNIEAGSEPHRIEQRFDRQARDRREEVVIGRRKVVMALSFKRAQSFGILG